MNPLFALVQSIKKMKKIEDLKEIRDRSFDIFEGDKESLKRIEEVYKRRINSLNKSSNK
jgi:hypothetical protein